VIGEEIHKLMAAGFIKEVFHPEWLANPVLVRKKGGKWRMCVDYTGLNKACPKVPYPLSRIDQIVDSTAGCETLSFLDAYSGYHPIRMKEFDQLATSFITPFGMYCYVTMPFGLRNAGATYQRCMNHVFGALACAGRSAQPEAPSARPEVPSAPEDEALDVEEEQSGATPDRDWQAPYLRYLRRGELPLDQVEARRVARRAKSFVLLGNEEELYHRSPSGLL
jgi:hypothetical protein